MTRYISPVPRAGIPEHWEFRNCLFCQTEFGGPPARMSRRSYCSKTCAHGDQSRAELARLDARAMAETGQPFRPTRKTLRSRRWEVRFPGRRASQRAVARALASGRMLPAMECSRCRATADDSRLTYHHWSYRPEHRLVIEPLCAPCHKIADSIRALAERAGYLPHQILAKKWALRAALTEESAVG